MTAPATRSPEAPERSWQVTRQDLARYAGAALDFNEIHIDDAAARRAGYERAIAHGMLTLGRVLARLADANGAAALSSCRGRFAAPALVGSTLTSRATPAEDGALSVLVKDPSGRDVVSVDVELGQPAQAQPLDGEVVADRVLVVERGPATRFAAAVGAEAAHWYDAAAARSAGMPGIPLVPTFAFALAGWGWFPELQHGGPRTPPDAVRDCQEWVGRPGAVIHAGQDFAYHRCLHVGDVVRSTSHVLDRFSKRGRSGDLHFTVVGQRLTADDGAPVLTSTMTLLVREAV